MIEIYPLLLALGSLAVSSGLVILITDIISIVLYQSPSTNKAEVLALLSSTFHGTTLVLMALLVCQYFKHHNPRNPEKLKPRGYLIAFAGASCVISSAVTALELVLVKNRRANKSHDPKILRPPESLILGAVISGVASMISQCTFVITLASLGRKKRTNKSILSNSPEQSTQMSSSIHTQPSTTSIIAREKYFSNNKSSDLKLSSLKHNSLKITKKLFSTRSFFFSQQNNTKYVPKSIRSPPHQISRSQTPNLLLLDRNNRHSEVGKTSTDINRSHSYESLALPSTHKQANIKLLETIPASPTDPSCVEDFRSILPQNPQPVARRNESTRSFSPASSYRETRRYSRSPTPVEINRESHIHPLFRTDSSDPPPAITPGTIVTAAPGAGKVISNRASIRSLRSKKSASSLQSRRKNMSSSENLPNFTENENLRMLQQEPLPNHGNCFDASN